MLSLLSEFFGEGLPMKVIGLMSGTSVDGIDAALVELDGDRHQLHCQLLGFQTYAYPSRLRLQILQVCAGEALRADQFAELDEQVASCFAQAATDLQQKFGAAELIGSHGQTIFHLPANGKLGYSWQLGRGEAIAHHTQLPTVSNFRQADIAAGGQGAPLVPKVDAYLLAHPNKYRCIQNLGGIGNVAFLPPQQKANWDSEIIGWDTGPGNVLLDLAIQKITAGQQAYDQGGVWAAQGTPNHELVNCWLQDPFIHQVPPKSTGREYFGVEFLERCWQMAEQAQLSEADWLASLTEFTVLSIVENYRQFLPQMPEEVLLCGGGSRNDYLKERLQCALGDDIPVLSTDTAGVSHEAKEAIAFAVLAYWRYVHQLPGNLPKVTGANKPMLLGDIHCPATAKV